MDDFRLLYLLMMAAVGLSFVDRLPVNEGSLGWNAPDGRPKQQEAAGNRRTHFLLREYQATAE